MVINKNNCIHSIQETPALSKIPQVAQLLSIGVLENLSYLDAVLELSDPAHACVLCGLDGFATLVDHLHEDVRASAAREPLGGQVMQRVKYRPHIIGPHMFGGINPVASNTPVHEHVQVANDFTPDIFFADLEVP